MAADSEKFKCANETAIPPRPRCQQECPSCKIWKSRAEISKITDLHQLKTTQALDRLHPEGPDRLIDTLWIKGT